MPIAFLSGIMRDSRCMPPAPAARPTRGSGRANVALSDATMMSQASAISKPPPMATPLTAAITGLSRSKRLARPPKPLAGWTGRLPVLACSSAWYFRSLPAQKALSPAPVMMATHSSGLACELVEGCDSSWFAIGWQAL